MTTLRDIELAGANARATDIGYFDNPYLKAEALPAATGETPEVWALKEAAWAQGWTMEDLARTGRPTIPPL